MMRVSILGPDHTPRTTAPNLCLDYLVRHVCPNTYDKDGISELRKSIKSLRSETSMEMLLEI